MSELIAFIVVLFLIYSLAKWSVNVDWELKKYKSSQSS